MTLRLGFVVLLLAGCLSPREEAAVAASTLAQRSAFLARQGLVPPLYTPPECDSIGAMDCTVRNTATGALLEFRCTGWWCQYRGAKGWMFP